MENVKRTFFLTAEEAKEQNKITSKNISPSMPHYELENGAIVFCTETYSNGMMHFRYYSSVK